MAESEPPKMPIAMICEKRHDKGEPDVFYPAAFCCACGERIATAKEGSVYWQPAFDAGPDRFYASRWPVTFAHKNCDRAVRVYKLWMPLEDFVTFLARNLGVPAGDAPDANR